MVGGELLLVATERQVESVLAQASVRVRTVPRFVADLVERQPLPQQPSPQQPSPQQPSPQQPLQAATPAAMRLATAHALDALDRESVEGLWLSLGPSRARVAPGWALACALDDALGALRRAGTEPSKLLRLNDARSRLLGRLLESTDALVARAGLYDPRGAGFLAARAIAAAPRCSLPSRVVVDGWLDWSAADLSWIEALARRAPVTVRLAHCHEADRSGIAAFWDDAILARLETRWQASQGSPEIELVDVGCPRPEALIEADHDEAQCRVIVDEVARALRQGAEPERVGVLVADLDEAFMEPLRAQLAEARIPYSEPRGRAPLASPHGAAALGWLDLLALPLHREPLIELLEAPAVDPGAWIAGPDLSTRRRRALALASLLGRVPVGADPGGKLLLAAVRAKVDQGTAPAWMRESLGALVTAIVADGGDGFRSEIAARLRCGFDRLGLYEIESVSFRVAIGESPCGADRWLGEASLRDAACSMRALDVALETVERAGNALGMSRQVVTMGRFAAELHAALSTASTEPSARKPGSIRIVRSRDAAAQAWDMLVVARASEGALGQAAADALLEDTLVAELPVAQRPDLPWWHRSVRTLEVGLAMSRARHFVLTRRCTDGEGHPEPAAPIFTAWAEHMRVEQEPANWVLSHRQVTQRATGVVRTARGGAPEDPDVQRRVRIELDRLRFFFDPNCPADAHTGSIALASATAPEHVRRAVGGSADRPMALTMVERAADCRFAAWAERVLGAMTEEEAAEAVEPWQRGTLVHRGLKVALDALVKKAKSAPLEQRVAVAMQCARRALLKPPVSPLHATEVERALRDVDAVVRWSLEDEGAFRYLCGEQSFGSKEDAWGPLCIPVGSDRVYLRGRIDRIDVSHDQRRLRVLDYKTGAAPRWGLVGIRKFQPVLYAIVARRELGPLLFEELRSFYLQAADRPVRAKPADASKQILSPDQVAQAERNAATIVARLWEGDIAPRPVQGDLCGACGVRGICRRPVAAPAEDDARADDSESP